MSSVRACDNCGTIFSEAASGWGTAPVTSMQRNKDTGRMESVTSQKDMCPDCNNPAGIHTDPPPLHMKGAPDYAKIRALETDLGMSKDDG